MAQSPEQHSAASEKQLTFRRRYVPKETARHRADPRIAVAQKRANRHRTRQRKAADSRGMMRDRNNIQRPEIWSGHDHSIATWRDDLDEDQWLPKPQSLLDHWQTDPFSARPTDLPPAVVAEQVYMGIFIPSVL